METKEDILKQRKLQIEGAQESYNFSVAENLKEEKQDISYSSYPSPRKYEIERLRTTQEGAALLPIYKEEISAGLNRAAADGTISKREAERLIGEIHIAEQGREEALLSTLRVNSGITMEKVLRFIPEEVYRQNLQLQALSDGTAYRALKGKSGDTQLSLFFEMEEQSGDTIRNAKAPVLRYNAREWVKIICGTTNPKNSQIRQIDSVIEKLSNFRIYYPLGDGQYLFRTLIQRTKAGVLDAKRGIYEYITLSPYLTLALAKGKRGGLLADTEVVWKLPLSEANKVLGKASIEWALLDYLELLYSYAYSDIKKASAQGSELPHKEEKAKLLSKLLGESATKTYSSRSSNKDRNLKGLASAFAKMEELGYIAKGSFKEEKSFYSWRWALRS